MMSDVRFMGFKVFCDILTDEYLYPIKKGLGCFIEEKGFFIYENKFEGWDLLCLNSYMDDFRGLIGINPVFRVPARTERW